METILKRVQESLAVRELLVRGFDYSREISCVLFCRSGVFPQLFAVFAYKLHQFDSIFHEICMFVENLISSRKNSR